MTDREWREFCWVAFALALCGLVVLVVMVTR